MRVDYALRQHDQWYKGDGAYGDGPEFHWDYYNSFVIHPMMLDVLDTFRDEAPAWKDLAAREEPRARRYAAVQERLIAPDGTFPAIGRSLAYRFGALQVLAQMALRHALPQDDCTGAGPRRPDGRHPPDDRGAGDVRCGWLAADRLLRASAGRRRSRTSRRGACICARWVCLPLGLPPSDEFWSAPPQPWTSAKAWSGEAFPIDHALNA